MAVGNRSSPRVAPDLLTLGIASLADWDRKARGLRPVYTAVNESDADVRLDELYQVWGDEYPEIRTLWTNAWVKFVPCLDYSSGGRRVIW